MLNQNTLDTIEQLQLASQNMPKVWEGRTAILEMKEGGSRNWKQMEWMGFYFEFLCETHFEGIIEMPGKTYRKTTFDAFREISWDFKVHASNTAANRIRRDFITNDAAAIQNTINDHGFYGIILAIGQAKYNDEQANFKRWHDALKGGISEYEINRINRDAPSRTRKTEFILSKIHLICLNTETLNQCSSLYQQGRNANGRPRPPKFNVNIQRIPDSALAATLDF